MTNQQPADVTSLILEMQRQDRINSKYNKAIKKGKFKGPQYKLLRKLSNKY